MEITHSILSNISFPPAESPPDNIHPRDIANFVDYSVQSSMSVCALAKLRTQYYINN